jgi:hypothetical protein
MFVNGSGRNEQSLQRTFHRYFLPRFVWFGQAVSEEKIFKNRPIRNNNCLWRPWLLMDRDKMSKLYRGPSIDASYQVSVRLAKVFQRRRLQCEMLTDDRRRTIDAKWWQKLTLPLARWANYSRKTPFHKYRSPLKCPKMFRYWIIYLICCPCPPLITWNIYSS